MFTSYFALNSRIMSRKYTKIYESMSRKYVSNKTAHAVCATNYDIPNFLVNIWVRPIKNGVNGLDPVYYSGRPRSTSRSIQL